ncbi:MAG: replication-relaxation family protein [Enhydrobacter sp.]|nr:MAG: replication-relaxation family protein [Enhydrobacter sp.]
MEVEAQPKPQRLPRFRRAAVPPAFRLTEDDVRIVRLVARYRFVQSTHIASLVGRSLDRTNDRLRLLFHAGYLDRPRAQLDYYPSTGSAPMVYALADKGARLLAQDDPAKGGTEWSRRNREAGRPFIEHQLGVMDFQVALQLGVQRQPDLELISAEELIASFPSTPSAKRNPFALHARLPQSGLLHAVAVIPDLAFGLRFRDGSRRCFMVEIDRGTMPVSRTDIRQTSIDRKLRSYLAAYAERQHEKRFGWKTFRVLFVVPDEGRLEAMTEVARSDSALSGVGGSLFLFAALGALQKVDPIGCGWRSGGRTVWLHR